eukprot:TRINITY_DN4701_c0_g1_i1.p2 TRINITY_DN4701_c0_g1~~TRINITY_DN4701_c0_g1_i1.p2  ORF type:complete len:105 (+),score=15.08 TRINITY_DN4701_c0_g1_i1:52-366(+)
MLRAQRVLLNVPVTVYRVLRYDYVPDVLEKRPAFRPAHLDYIAKYKEKGMVRMGGALDPASDGAMIILKADKADAEKFAKEDPYVVNGLVTKWSLQDWNVVVEA